MPKINFTKAALDQLETPAAGKRAQYQDQKQPGLILRVTPSGAKTFAVFRRVRGGSPELVTIGPYPDVSIEQARKRAMEIVGRLALGESVARGNREKRDELTLDELFEQFFRRHSKVRKRSWDSDQSNYRLYLGRHLGRRRLSELTKRQVVAVMDQIVTEGKSPVTAERAVLSLGRKLYNWATQEAGLWDGENPFTGIRGAPKTKRARFLLPHELPRFFRAVAMEENDTIRDFVLLALLTGQRRGNVQAMRWRDIDLELNVWRIDGSEFKNGEHQAIPLTSMAVEVLRARRNRLDQAEPYVFPGLGTTGHLVEPKKGWKRILARAEGLGLIETIAARLPPDELEQAMTGLQSQDARALDSAVGSLRRRVLEFGGDPAIARLDGLVVHDLRRSMGSWQAIEGASLAIIGRSLGHKSPQATAIYARLHVDPVRASMEKATEAMFRAAGATKELSRRSVPGADKGLIPPVFVPNR